VVNRICLADPAQIVGRQGNSLFRRLQVLEAPDLETLLAVVTKSRQANSLLPDRTFCIVR
jgi:hypothetical protein